MRTIQLYGGDEEENLPITSLGSGSSLTLEFDLMSARGRPLSVYFQHANREWRRDLSDTQILESFQDDRLVDYQSSRGTKVEYTHYEYRFPNDDIRFRLSGNYILRVTERGRRDSVLFERAFFLTEDAGSLDLESDSYLLPNQSRPSIQPIAEYTPPNALRGDPFGYSVCFIRDGRLPEARCETRPNLASQPQLEFRLNRDRAFAPVTANYSVDLSRLQPGREIARTDRMASPTRVILDSDYARFEGNGWGANTNGQIVVRDALMAQADPALTAEYVQTQFSFVPAKEQPYGSRVLVTGSFSGMDPNRGIPMTWNASLGQYEGSVLLKQGRYQYFYASDDPALASQIAQTRTSVRSRYMSLVYYNDARYATDRLLQVNTFTP